MALSLSLAAAPSASAQLIYFVNARTGAPGNNGLTPGAPFASVRQAFGSMAPAQPGAFQTLRIAGTYTVGTTQVIVHDDLRENWSGQSTLNVPASIQIEYDLLNSDKDPVAGYAPVIFDGTGANTQLFTFAATTTEPSSRIDGANGNLGTTGYANAFIVFRNAAEAIRVQPPSSPVAPLGAIPPGASFRRIRWEGCGYGAKICANFAVTNPPPVVPFSFTLNPVFEDCHFVGNAQTVSGTHIYAEAYESANGLPSYDPVAGLSVRDSRFEVGPGGVGAGAFSYAIHLFSRGLTHNAATGTLGGVGGTSASVNLLLERSEILGIGTSPTRQRGIFAEAVHFLGNASILVRDSSIHDLGSTGVFLDKRDEGASFLNLERTNVFRCGQNPSGSAEDESGIVTRGRHNIFANGYGGPSTLVATRLANCQSYEHRRHGVLLHNPRVVNTPQAGGPILFGTDQSLVMERCALYQNGTSTTTPPMREGSGLLVHLEQGSLVGPTSGIITGPLSSLVGNDVYQNALHGIHLLGASTIGGTAYSIAFHGTLVNNVIDQNGFPYIPGAPIASNELRCELDATNTAIGNFVWSQLEMTQNTFFDADYFSVSFPAVAGASHVLAGFRGNLVSRDPNYPASLFGLTVEGFAAPTAPSGVQDNVCMFDNAGVNGSFPCNCTVVESQTLSSGALGYFVNPVMRDYRIVLNPPGLGLNPAVDRAGNSSAAIPGQLGSDKVGNPRVVDQVAVIGCPALPGNQSDSGALELQ